MDKTGNYYDDGGVVFGLLCLCVCLFVLTDSRACMLLTTTVGSNTSASKGIDAGQYAANTARCVCYANCPERYV
jgi:hypothetical protein